MFYTGAILPVDDNEAHLVEEGLRMAVDYVNSQQDILPKHILNITLNDYRLSSNTLREQLMYLALQFGE